MIKVSVIIPVFNNEKSIGTTLDSLLNQTFDYFEGIIVNDGSTDGSLEIIKEYCDKDDRLSYIDMANGGVSSARNAGIEKAQGEFITFLDADDILPPKSLQWMNHTVNTEICDTVIGEYERVDGLTAYINKRSQNASEKRHILSADDPDLLHFWSVCTKWFDRNLIIKNNIRFEKITHLEDAVFFYNYLRYAKRLATCPHVIYTYIKPLPIFGRTSTQLVKTEMLTSSRSAFDRLLEITSCYGPSFRYELIYRYLFVVLGDYYRKLWMMDVESYQTARSIINELMSDIPKEYRQRIFDANKELFINEELIDKDQIIEHPDILILVKGVYERSIDDFLKCLYDQQFPCFKVLLDNRYDGYISQQWLDKENLSLAIDSDLFEEANSVDNRFLSFIDTNSFFDSRSLLRMNKVLNNNVELDYVCLSVVDQNNDGLQIFDDYYHSNKLFRNEIYERSFFDSDDTDIIYKHLKKPVMIDFTDLEELLEVVEDDQKIQYLKGGDDVQLDDGPINSEDIPNKPKPNKAKTYYYNLSIEEDSILIEALGKRPIGNSLYLLRELQKERYSDMTIYFSVKKDTKKLTKEIFKREGFNNITLVEAGSNKYKKALFSAKYLFNEVDFPNWWIKKPGQVYTNLWHGTPLKALGKKKKGDIHHDANGSRNFTMADYILIPNHYSHIHILEDCEVDKIAPGREILVGYPRTSILFDREKASEIRRDKRYKFGKKTIIAWMPTYRDEFSIEEIESFLLKMDKMLKRREIMLVNLHHKTDEQIDFSKYAHIQPFPKEYDTYETLCATDVLITDYSSVMFDYAVKNNRIILYTPDSDDYLRNRGMNIDLDDLPFDITKDAKETISLIRSAEKKDYTDFLLDFAPYDSINNARLLCETVISDETDNNWTRLINQRNIAFDFIISDDFGDEWANIQLQRLFNEGWPDNTYLSFTEEGVDTNRNNAYPLIMNVPIYATKGKKMNARSERYRLYNDINISRFILVDVSDTQKINAFAGCDEMAFLFINETTLSNIKDGDKKTIKAIKRFAKYANGIYVKDGTTKQLVEEMCGIQVTVSDLIDVIKQQ